MKVLTKNLVAILTVIVIAFTFSIAISFKAAADSSVSALADFKYTLREGVAEIEKYTGNSGDVLIPNEIDGKEVVVCPNAFNDLKNLKSVTFVEVNPKTYTAYVPYQPAVSYQPAQVIPPTTKEEIIGMETDYSNLILPGAWITDTIWREPVYGIKPTTLVVEVPSYTIPEVAAKDAVPSKAASGISQNIFDGCNKDDLVIYVPQNALNNYKNLFKDYTVLPSFTADSLTAMKKSVLGIPQTVISANEFNVFDIAKAKRDLMGIINISIKTLPSKTEYEIKDALNTDGLILEIKNQNGKTETVTEGFTCSQTILNNIGTQTIIVTYKGKTAWFDVEVADKVKSISINTNPSQTLYTAEETLYPYGLVLNVNYESGVVGTITDGYACSPIELNNVGTQEITVSYGDKTTSFNVTVADKVVDLKVASLPKKTAYYDRDTLDTSGLTLTATYFSGKKETVTSGFDCSTSEYWDDLILQNGGTQPIYVSYGGCSTTFNVEVTWLEITNVKLINSSYLNPITIYTWENNGTVWVDMTVEVSYNSGVSIVKNYSCDAYCPRPIGKAGTYTQDFTASYIEKLGSGETYYEDFEFSITVYLNNG